MSQLCPVYQALQFKDFIMGAEAIVIDINHVIESKGEAGKLNIEKIREKPLFSQENI